MSNIEFQSLDKIRQEIADICVKIDELTLYFNTYSVPSDNILWLQYHHMKEYHNTLKTRAMRLEREHIILNQSNNNGWISVDDYLPIPESNYYDDDFKPENFYLIQLKDGFVNTACYAHYDDCDLDKYWFVSCTLSVVENKYTVQEIGFDCYEIDEVKYWKPHPQPPQE